MHTQLLKPFLHYKVCSFSLSEAEVMECVCLARWCSRSRQDSAWVCSSQLTDFLRLWLHKMCRKCRVFFMGRLWAGCLQGGLFVKEERQASMSIALQNVICAGLKNEKLQRKCLWCSLSYSMKLLHLHTCWLLLICIWMVSGDRMQLAINVQIPVKLGGVGGHAIYIGMWSCIHETPPPFLSLSHSHGPVHSTSLKVGPWHCFGRLSSADTEGSFMLERALQMTKASIDELVLASSLSSPMDDDLIQQLDIDTYLSHIYLVRVHDPTEQLAVINNLPNLLKEHNQVHTCTQKLQILSDMQTKVVMFLTILSEWCS